MKRVAAAGIATFVGWVLLAIAMAWKHAPYQDADTRAEAVTVDEWVPVMAREVEEQGFSGYRLNPGGEALVVGRPKPFRAVDLPRLRLKIDHLPLNYVLMFAWTAKGAEAPHFVRLQPATGRYQTYLLSRFDQWQGEIVEIALYVHPQQQSSPPQILEAPLRIEELTFSADTLSGRLAAMITGWFAPDPWEMLSISSLGALTDLEEGSRFLPFVAAAAAIAIAIFGLALGANSLRAWVRISAPVVLLTTLVMTAQFLWGLSQQQAATDRLYQGLDHDERQALLFDADLVEIVREIEPLLPAAGTGRIFIGADDRFFQLRAAWHLRPHNVITRMPGQQSSVPDSVVPGDFVFFYRRPDLQAAGREGQVSTGDFGIQVEILHQVADHAGLLRVTGVGA